MQRSLLLILMLLPQLSLAATTEFDVQAQLLVEGKLIASPRVLTLPGETAELSQMTDTSPDRLRVRIVASDDSHQTENGIALKFEIYYRKGSKIVEISPEVLTTPGKETTFLLSKKNEPTVELKVRAGRIE